MRLSRNLLPQLCLLLAAASATFAIAQTTENVQPVASRVMDRVDDARRVTLAGNTHPFARSKYQTGSVEPGRLLERIVLVLKRSPEQEAALAAFNERQQDPKSPDYHHWLHAEEFGQLYGPSDSDVAAITGWLQNHGFSIYDVSKGRTMIQFSGTAAQVQEAFQVEMLKYNVNGEEHIANDRDPSIPEALAPVVTGIASLHNFFPKPQHVLGKRVSFNTRTHLATPIGSERAPQPKAPSSIVLAKPASGSKGLTPQETYTYNGNTYEEMTPYDFAAVYNILPLWNAGTPITGKGVTVALSGVSDVNAADFNTFRSAFGLPATTLKTIVNGADPGADGGGGQEENSLDVEMAGATAPGASIVLVVSGNTSTTGGDQLSDQYIVDKEVAPIMSASYGECELGLGKAGNAAFNSIWQQGATEGISIFESSGDQGSAGCSSQDTPAPNADQYGLQVNGMASSPYVTGVGGTDLNWQPAASGPTEYWNAGNASYYQSAKGIMPEVPWNSTCTSVPLLMANSSEFASSEALCNGVIGGSYQDLIVITGGSGGPSHCTTPSSNTPSSCAGGYAKPSWQTGFGTTTHREVPDISLFASGGLPAGLDGSAILFCDSTNGACKYGTNVGGTLQEIEAQEVGGTSASSPLWAGIAALIVQKTGEKQGLINPTLYSLFAKQKAAGTSCNSNTVTNGNSCTFYDTTLGSNAQVCYTGAPNCVTNTSGDQLGVLSGYSTATGYDDATGLGTPNVTNMVNAWPKSTPPAPAVTLSPTSLTFASTKVGTTTAAQVVTVKNSGTAALTLSSETITGTNASSFLKSATTCGTSLAVGASCTVSVEFKPAAAGTLTGSLAIADNATGSPQSVKLTGTGAGTPAVTLSASTLTFAATKIGTTTAAQVVTVKNSGTAALTLTSETITGTNASSFLKSATTCGTSLAVGASCTVSVEFKPAAVGSLTASLAIADNATGSPQSVKLTGTGTGTPAITLSASTLTFAATKIGTTTAAQTVTVKNSGTAALTLTSETITGTNASSFLKSATTCGTSLAVGASCTVSVEFKPAAAGTLTGSLAIADNATGSPQAVKLTGTGTGTPAVTLSASTLTFAATKIGTTTAAQAVTVKNSGTAALTLSSETITGTNASSFLKSATTCGTSLAVGASCTVSVEFKPAAAGALTASLAIADNATGSPQAVKLTGTGVGTPAVTFSATSLTYATTKVGSTTAAQAVTIKNSGTAALTLTSETITGTNASSFLKSATTCGTSLAAGASCTVSVEFKPAAKGALTGSLAITDNAAGSPQAVKLAGTGD